MTIIAQSQDHHGKGPFHVADRLDSAFDGVALALRSGETTSLIGRSGSGKSTLISLIAGVMRPDAGHIHIGGQQTDKLDEAVAKIRGEGGRAEAVTMDVTSETDVLRLVVGQGFWPVAVGLGVGALAALAFDLLYGLIDLIIYFFISRTFKGASTADLGGAPKGSARSGLRRRTSGAALVVPRGAELHVIAVLADLQLALRARSHRDCSFASTRNSGLGKAVL